MNWLRTIAVLLCISSTALPTRSHAAEKKPDPGTRANDAKASNAKDGNQAREAILSALKLAVEPAFGAAREAKLKKVGVVVVPEQPTAVQRRVASVVLDELDRMFPRPAKGADDAPAWDISRETQGVLAARRDAANASARANRPKATRGPAAAAAQASAPPPELTCDGILAVVCRMKGPDASVEFSLLRAPATGSRKPEAPGKPLWKGAATLARADLAALPNVPDLNLKVLSYARDHVGQQVGDGECWTLAKEALEAAGAKLPVQYTFGRELRAGEPALPGDVLQFTSVRLDHKDHSWQTLGTPHHTAIVVQADGEVYSVLHQNMGGVKTVVPGKFNLADKTSGTVQIFRPLSASGR
jgi:hypothetical protein